MNGDPGAIRTREASPFMWAAPTGETTNCSLFARSLPTSSVPKLGSYGGPRDTCENKMVTRARFERATPSFGGWAACLNSLAISNIYRHLVPFANDLNGAKQAGHRCSRRARSGPQSGSSGRRISGSVGRLTWEQSLKVGRPESSPTSYAP
jgi:hypothetical protein